jgi:hypothetical protein
VGGVVGQEPANPLRLRVLPREAVWSVGGRLVVFLGADVPTPSDRAAGLVALLHGDVDHQPVWRGAVPVVLAGLEEDAVAGANDLDGAAFALADRTPA